MQGVSEFRHQPGVRRLPRPGAAGSSPGLLRLPGLRARRSRYGAGAGRAFARERFGWGVTFVPFFAAARTLLGRLMPICERIALRPAARSFLAPPEGATRCGVQPHYSAGAPWRPCLRPAGNRPYAPSRGAGKAAAFSRLALPLRRASVVTTGELARLGSDDAVRLWMHGTETRSLRGFSSWELESPISAGKCQRAKRKFFHPVAKKVVTPSVCTLFARQNWNP